MLEFGAGTGRLTRALSRRAGLVVAVELDPDLVERLTHGFRTNDRVRVLQGDFLEIPLPDEPFRVFGNLPFGLSTTTMRHLLDDVDSPMTRADLLIQFEAARKRACVWPSSLASLGWLPWWEFRLVRHIHRGCFDPPPPVDGAILSITRRDPPLLRAEQRAAFVWLLRNAFGGGSQPLRRSLAKRISGRS